MIKAKGMILIFMLVLTIILTQTIQATTVHGTVYGPNLELAEKALVEINSTPKQNMVANDGIYSFVVSNGTYEIEAFYSYQGILLYDKEIINLPDKGDFVLDIILFETEDIENLNFDESELKLIEGLLKEKKNNTELIIGVIIAVIIITAIIFYFIYKKSKKKKRKKKSKHKKTKLKIKKLEGDELFNKVLSYIKNERRVKQKDLRKKFNVSEAKMSLLMIDMENQGLIQKIKKGRGNIVVWNK